MRNSTDLMRNSTDLMRNSTDFMRSSTDFMRNSTDFMGNSTAMPQSNKMDCLIWDWYFSIQDDIEVALGQIFIISLLIAYMVIYAVFSLLFDIIDFLSGFCIKRTRRFKKYGKKKKDLIVASTFYRIIQFLYMFWCLDYLIRSFLTFLHDVQQGSGNVVIAISFIGTSFLSVWYV